MTVWERANGEQGSRKGRPYGDGGCRGYYAEALIMPMASLRGWGMPLSRAGQRRLGWASVPRATPRRMRPYSEASSAPTRRMREET